VNFHATAMQDGSKLNAVYLQPKKILFFKDCWHCPNGETAKKVARKLLTFKDVEYLELKGVRWVFVNYHAKGNHELEGQETDKREIVRGR